MTTTLSKYNHQSSQMQALTGVTSAKIKVVSIFAFIVLNVNSFEFQNTLTPNNCSFNKTLPIDFKKNTTIISGLSYNNNY